jgi:hypothetical protein
VIVPDLHRVEYVTTANRMSHGAKIGTGAARCPAGMAAACWCCCRIFAYGKESAANSTAPVLSRLGNDGQPHRNLTRRTGIRGGSKTMPVDEKGAEGSPTVGRRRRPSRGQVVAALAALLGVGLGLLIGVFVINNSTNGSPNDSLACSYFWQFEAAPNIPTLAQDAFDSHPGTGSGSHYLNQWLYTLDQQVSSSPITMADLQNDSRDGTALGIGAICQQLGFTSPGS